jgi:hypothetical protein
MEHTIKYMRKICFKLLEFFVVLLISVFFLSKVTVDLIESMSIRCQWLDSWFQCYILENQVTRILGMNPGGLWEGGLFYPFHKLSLLFDEPHWGVSLIAAPFWLFLKNIFPIYFLGGIFATVISWVLIYYLVKSISGSKIWSFYAAAVFCLSGINFSLILQCCFWPFFLIPAIGIVTKKIFTTQRLYWGVVWGILFGYLAWSSAHIFVMGGIFICLFVLYNLIFQSHSKKILLALLIGIVITVLISCFVLGKMFLIHKEFNFYRSFNSFYLFSANWQNLIYRRWPLAPFNIIAKLPFFEYIKNSAKGESNIGMSAVLIAGAIIAFVKRLIETNPSYRHRPYMMYGLVLTIFITSLFAYFNMHFLSRACLKLTGCLPKLAIMHTYIYYIAAGIIIYMLYPRIKSAVRFLDFSLILMAIIFGLLAFGPYYLTGSHKMIPSFIVFLQYYVPGFSSIQATARWGLVMSFTLSVAVAVFLSKLKMGCKLKFFTIACAFISVMELSPGFQVSGFNIDAPYKWSPRETDVFLKNTQDNGALLELSSYPPVIEQNITSENSLGYFIFSQLYHKKPLVLGYGLGPHVTYWNIFFPEDKEFDYETAERLRKFGAKYWVFHINGWGEEDVKTLKESVKNLKKITELDNGMTLIYEDPAPKVSVTLFEIK